MTKVAAKARLKGQQPPPELPSEVVETGGLDWWTDEPESESSSVSHRPKSVPRSKNRSVEDDLRIIQNEVFEEALGVVQGSLKALEIDPADPQMPEEWVSLYGLKTATKMFRAAQYALCNSKSAPVVLKIAQDTVSGIARARAAEKSAPRTLNISLVKMPTAEHQVFDSILVDDSSD